MLNLSKNQCKQLIEALGGLAKDKVSLEQVLRAQTSNTEAAQEELYLELLEVSDALESLLEYLGEDSPSSQSMRRLPKALSNIHQKLLNILERRQVHPMEITGTQADFATCQIVDYEIRDDLKEQTITQVVRKGFKLGNKVLRPTEVIVTKSA